MPSLPIHTQLLSGGRSLVRPSLIAICVGTALWFSSSHLGDLDPQKVWTSLFDLSPAQWSLALLATLLAFLAVAGQERAVIAHVGLTPPVGHARASAMSVAAIAQTVGFGPVIGAVVRRRLLPDLTLAQSLAISLGISIAFLLGLGLCVLVCLSVLPDMQGAQAAQAVLALTAVLMLAYLILPKQSIFGYRLPTAQTVLRLMVWVMVDLVSLAIAFWVLLPAAATEDFLTVFPVFVMALGIGLISGSPAGAGPFEATMLLYLPQVDPNAMAAGIIGFRAVAYALPAIIGMIWALAGHRLLGPVVPAAMQPVTLDSMTHLPRAEVQLVRQGHLHLMATATPSSVWASGTPGITRVFLGDPLAGNGPASMPETQIRAAHDLARREGRSLCLYKTGARIAATARQCGLRVVPVSREAVLTPQQYDLNIPARAALRRKLRHSAKAGVRLDSPLIAPVAEMARVSLDWVSRMGGERGFSMGQWDIGSLSHQRVFLAYDQNDSLIAFVTFHVCNGEWVLDLIRHAGNMPDGTLHGLINLALETARSEGVPRLSLAAVPHHSFGLNPKLWARLPSKLHPSKGLEQFKSSFAPVWETRYLAARGRVGLVIAGLCVFVAVNFTTRVSDHSRHRLTRRRTDTALRRHQTHVADIEAPLNAVALPVVKRLRRRF